MNSAEAIASAIADEVLRRVGTRGHRLLRLADIIERTGLSKTALYRLEVEGGFPKRIPLTPQVSGWLESEVDAWIETKASMRGGEPD